MREGFAPFIAVVASAFTAAVLTLLLAWVARPRMDSSDVFVGFCFVFVACFAYSMLVGLPIALALVHKHRFRLAPMSIAGAVAGFLPAALLFWPGSLADPVPLRDLALFGAVVACGGFIGSASGAAFFAAHRLMSPNNSFKPKPLRGSA